MKKLPAKRFKKESYFCAIQCFIAELYSFFDTRKRVSESWTLSELNNSGVIDFADQLDSQFFRDLWNSLSCTRKFLGYKRLGNFFPQKDLEITDWLRVPEIIDYENNSSVKKFSKFWTDNTTYRLKVFNCLLKKDFWIDIKKAFLKEDLSLI